METAPKCRESSQYPGVLAAAALAGVDDERTLAQRHPRQSPWQDADLLRSAEDVGAEVDVAPGQVSATADRVGDEGWVAGEGDHWLGDVVARLGDDARAELGDLRVGGSGADQHAVAAALV